MTVELIIPVLSGWLAGLLVNYLSDVLPKTRRLSQPLCPHCSTPGHWADYWLLRDCPSCKYRRSGRTWIVQIFFVLFAVYIWINPPRNLGFWLGLFLLTYLAVVLVIDLEHRLILHPVSIIGTFLGLGSGIFLHGLKPTLIGGLAGFGIMFIFYLFGVLFTRFRARRMRASGQVSDNEEALGFGDVNLAGIMGLVLGWPLIWFGLLLGILAGGLVSLLIIIVMLISGRYKQKAMMVFIPYGPYFIMSTLFLLYIPNWISTKVP